MNHVRSALLASLALVNIPFTEGKVTTPPFANATSPLPTDGNGTLYASACASAHLSYTSATSAWFRDHLYTSFHPYTFNGSTLQVNTYYESATTLCDGKARVPTSPAIPLSTKTTTFWTGTPYTSTQSLTAWHEYTGSYPSCSIKPSDCDALWQDYDRTIAAMPQITPPPQTPPCWNSSYASSVASIESSYSGCGKCTVFGQGVQLLYFPVPTTVSRDMCATTPSASLTQYGPGAVITAYAGTAYSGMNDSIAGQRTAIVNGHTFTSGTAYISIASVWAEDRCFSHYGTTVSNAILAMPSESVLSLRYTQDHFQYFSDITTQTGHPVSYADFNEPVPYSAWNGQNICRAADDGWSCQIIYEGMYRPQLAIPPQIKDLSPEFADCQQWYNGLYDPPLALTEAAEEVTPTLPTSQHGQSTAMPSKPVAAPTSTPTAGNVDGPNHESWGGSAQSEIMDPAQSPKATSHPNEAPGGGFHPDAEPGHDESSAEGPTAANDGGPSTHGSTTAYQHGNDDTSPQQGLNAPDSGSGSAAGSSADNDHDETSDSSGAIDGSPNSGTEGQSAQPAGSEQESHTNIGAYIHSGVASWPMTDRPPGLDDSSASISAPANGELRGTSTTEISNKPLQSQGLGDSEIEASSGAPDAEHRTSSTNAPPETSVDQSLSHSMASSSPITRVQSNEPSGTETVYDLSFASTVTAADTGPEQTEDVACRSSGQTSSTLGPAAQASSSAPTSSIITGSASVARPAIGLLLFSFSVGVTIGGYIINL